MDQIQNLSDDPLQTLAVNLPDGSQLGLTLYYSDIAQGWFIRSLTYGTFTLQGLRVVTSPNILQQFRNQLPFGLACFTDATNREPMLQTDFSSGIANLFILSQAEVVAFTSYLQTKPTPPPVTIVTPSAAGSTYITSWGPVIGSILTTVPASFTVNFSAAMDVTSTTNPANWSITSTQGALTITGVTLNSARTTATVSVSGTPSARATITLAASNGVLDSFSNPLTESLSASFTFDVLARITAWSPAAGIGLAVLPATFTAIFSNTLDSATSQNVANWTATSTHGTVTVTSATLTNGTGTAQVVLAVTGSGVLTGDTITINANAGIEDILGEPITGGLSFTWLMAATPLILSSVPAVGNIGTVPTTLVINFNQAMGASATVLTNWAVTGTTGTINVTAAVLSSGGTVLTLTLAASTVYSGSTLVVTGSNILGANGTALGGSNTLTFTYYNGAIGSLTGLPLRPLATTSSWNQLLPNAEYSGQSNPTLASNSTAQITNLVALGGHNVAQQPGGLNGVLVILSPGDIGPIYTLTGSDPTVSIYQTGGYGFPSQSGIPMPTSAQAAGNSDGHLCVLNLSTGAQWDYYQFNSSNATITQGATIDCTAFGIVNFLTGNGWDEGSGTNGAPGSFGGIVTASGNTLMSGVVTVDELMSGRINHALSFATWANQGAAGVWPSSGHGNYTDDTTDYPGPMPGEGSLIWSDLTDAQVDALGWDILSSMILKAMHHYGAFCTDTGGPFSGVFNPRQIGVAPASNATAQTAMNNWWVANLINITLADLSSQYGLAGFYCMNLQAQSKAWFESHWHIVDPTWLQTLRGSVR